MKACLYASGAVAHLRNSYGYYCGSQLAGTTDSGLTDDEADH